MTDSNKGKELDELKNAENKALGDRSKTAGENKGNDQTLIAGLPKPKPRSLYSIPGGRTPTTPKSPPLYSIPGGRTPTTPKPSPTPNQHSPGSGVKLIPETPKPSSTSGQNSSDSQPTNSKMSDAERNLRLGADIAERMGLDYQWWNPLGEMNKTRDRINREVEGNSRTQGLQNNNPATPQVPPARSGNLGNNLLRSIDRAIPQSTPASTPATPMGPPRYNPDENTGDRYNGPVTPDPFKDLFKNKPKPTEEKKQKPGGSPQRQPGGGKKKVKPIEKPFRGDQFYQSNPEPWTEGVPGRWDPDVNLPAKKKSPTKKRTPADRPQKQSQPTIQDGPGQAPRPMTTAERNMVTNGPAQTPPTAPPATTPTPAQNPAPTPGGRRQETKKEAVERKYAGRPINGLTRAEKKEIREGGYTLSTNPKSGPPTIRRTRSTSGESGLHMEDVGGVWTIQKGPAPANNRFPSSPSKMKKNILEGTGVKEVPKDYQAHHGITVETWNSKDLTKLAQKYKVAGGVDAKDGMILAPSTLEAKNRTGGDISKLEQQGKLIRILHPGSHPRFKEFGDSLVDEETQRLTRKYGVDKLEQIPADKLPGELEKSIKKIRKEIDDALKNADQKIKAGKYNDLPQEVKDFIKPDPNRQNQYKISDRPTGQEVARFKNALGDVVAKARELNTYSLSVSSQAVLSSTNSTQQSYAEMLALSVAAAKGGDPATKNSLFTSQTRGLTTDIYANGSKLASINRENGKAEITMERRMTTSEKQNLSKQRSEMLSSSQAQAQAQKAQKIASNNSPQRGLQR
jgi:hypothetical protein